MFTFVSNKNFVQTNIYSLLHFLTVIDIISLPFHIGKHYILHNLRFFPLPEVCFYLFTFLVKLRLQFTVKKGKERFYGSIPKELTQTERRRVLTTPNLKDRGPKETYRGHTTLS